jgi:chromosome segregation ATPase
MGRSAHDARDRTGEYSLSMNDLEPLLGEIARLLDQAERDDDPARLERALTEGYAQALTLEAERSSLQQRVRELTSRLDERGGSSTTEVSALARRLDAYDLTFEQLRGELVRLRRRHSRAVRAATSWACQTSPDRTA